MVTLSSSLSSLASVALVSALEVLVLSKCHSESSVKIEVDRF